MLWQTHTYTCACATPQQHGNTHSCYTSTHTCPVSLGKAQHTYRLDNYHHQCVLFSYLCIILFFLLQLFYSNDLPFHEILSSDGESVSTSSSLLSCDPDQPPFDNSSFLDRNFICRFRCLLDNTSGFLVITQMYSHISQMKLFCEFLHGVGQQIIQYLHI